MRTVAVVLAGGTGRRFGAADETGTGQADAGGAGSSPAKQLLGLAGTALLERSVAAFDAAPGVDEVLVVMAAGFTELATQVLGAIGYRKLTGVIEGGAARAGSTTRTTNAPSRPPRRGP